MCGCVFLCVNGCSASRLGVPTWRPDLASRFSASRLGVPNWRPSASRLGVPNWGGSSASRMSYLLRYNLGGSRGCVIVHTGGTPPVPPQNRGNSSASRLGENPNRVYPEGPGKLGTPQKWCFGGANWCKFVQICANLCNLGGPENPGK